MELTINERKENALLLRTELKGAISFTGATPNFEALKKALASELKTSDELVAVKEIYTKFGFPQADFRANVYQTKEQLQLVEPKKKEKKQQAQKEAPKAKE